jgi:hypothetical protein
LLLSFDRVRVRVWIPEEIGQFTSDDDVSEVVIAVAMNNAATINPTVVNPMNSFLCWRG